MSKRERSAMPLIRCIWDDPEDPEGNVKHIAEHGLTIEEVEFVVQNPVSEAHSDSTGRDCCFGYTPSGEYIIVYDPADEDSIYPVTALSRSGTIRRLQMAKKRIQQVFRQGRVSRQEADRLNEIRRKVMKEFPPAPDRPRPATTGVGAQIRAAREAKGLTWYAVARLAGIPNPATIRDIEYGRDAKLSNIEAVAGALGLKLELVESSA
jgi:hypothetical protein